MTRSHLLLLLVLALAALWRWGETVDSDQLLPDERPYAEAARNLEAGLSPFEAPGYVYPPLLARVIQTSSRILGESETLKLLRFAALAGAVALLAWSLHLVAWPLFVRCIVGVGFICFAPSLALATDLGNIAGLAVALSVGALVVWPRYPLAAGAVLGLALVLKPVAPLAPLLLAVHLPAARGRKHLVAASVGAVVAAAILLPDSRYLPEFLAAAQNSSSAYNFSITRLLSDLGIGITPLAVSLAVAAIATALARHRLDRLELMTLTIAASLLSLPLLWSHSLLLFLPVLVLAVDACIHLLRSTPTSRASRLKAVMGFVCIASILLPQAAGADTRLPMFFVATARLAPLLSIAYLSWLALSHGRRRHALTPSATLNEHSRH